MVQMRLLLGMKWKWNKLQTQMKYGTLNQGQISTEQASTWDESQTLDPLAFLLIKSL